MALWSEIESLAGLLIDRDTEITGADASEEVDEFRRDEFGRHHEIAFVLPILVVDENDDAAGLEILDDVGNGCEAHREIIAVPDHRGTLEAMG